MDDDKQSDAWMDQLSDDARLIWSDAETRASALGDIVLAWGRGDPELGSLIDRVDSAVVVGLAALGFPRGPVRGISIETLGPGLLGRKHSDCRISFSGTGVEMVAALHDFDRFFSTWIHESIHARQPYSSDAGEEYQQHRGFEEGLVEGLTRYMLQQAGIPPVEGSFSFYVAAYEQLASTLDVQAVDLWRSLWEHPAGTVRDSFVDVIDNFYQQKVGIRLVHSQRLRIFITATGLFSRRQNPRTFNKDEIHEIWKRVMYER